MAQKVRRFLDEFSIALSIALLAVIFVPVILHSITAEGTGLIYRMQAKSFEMRLSRTEPNEHYGLIEDLYFHDDRYRTNGLPHPAVNEPDCPESGERFDFINIDVTIPRIISRGKFVVNMKPQVRSNDGTPLYFYRPGTYVEMLEDGEWVPAEPCSIDSAIDHGDDVSDFIFAPSEIGGVTIYNGETSVRIYDIRKTYRITVCYTDRPDFTGELFPLRFEFEMYSDYS